MNPNSSVMDSFKHGMSKSELLMINQLPLANNMTIKFQ